MNDMKIGWHISHLVSAILLTVVIWILNSSYQGEFVILYEGLWIFILFSIFIICNPIVYMMLAIYKKKKNIEKEFKIYPILLIISLVWNFILAILLIVIFVYLAILVVDYTGIPLLLVLALPFIGFSFLFIFNDVSVLIAQIKKKELQIIKGLGTSGIIFFLLFASFGLKLLVYNPQWSNGVNHQPLFMKGEAEREYRIPSMLILPGDIILAFIESRENAMLDWGDIDLVMKRSNNAGQTWSEIIIIRDEGDHTAGNPCPVFDNDTQTVWLPYCVDNKRVFVINSTDYGLTWSIPREITEELNLILSGSTFQLDMEYGTGPGNGIQLSSGRLIIPSYYFDERGSHVIYSDDHGKTWKKGENLGVGRECQVFESVNGSILINCRTSEDFRYESWSHDGGETWNTPYLQEDLPEIACMASIFRLTKNDTQDRNRILFSNPSKGSRGHLTLRLSYDEGNSWNVSKIIYTGPSAYSQIAVLSDFTICVFFEQGTYDYRESIQFCKITISWLTNGHDAITII